MGEPNHHGDEPKAPDQKLAYELFRLGTRLHPAEVAVGYTVIPFAFGISSLVGHLFRVNVLCQFTWFALVVQLPGYLTGKMSYVDIGWPGGLCILAANCLRLGSGWHVRRAIVCGGLLLHGVRMFVGALVIFFPYTFPNGDLSRYQFAKMRWVEIHELPAAWWPVKQQQETASQAWANSVVLACPIMLACSNPSTALHPLEVLGVAFWIGAWVVENIADIQKLKFLEDCKKRAKRAETKEEKQQIKQAVLGYAPFDGPEYWLWSTICRHPNYLAEWCVWLSYCVFALPSVLSLPAFAGKEGNLLLAVGLMGNYMVVRFFYECLVHWTGAEPAEFGSIAKRPLYLKYQTKLPVFFPQWVPFIDPHMEEAWPYPSHPVTERHIGKETD